MLQGPKLRGVMPPCLLEACQHAANHHRAWEDSEEAHLVFLSPSCVCHRCQVKHAHGSLKCSGLHCGTGVSEPTEIRKRKEKGSFKLNGYIKG